MRPSELSVFLLAGLLPAPIVAQGPPPAKVTVTRVVEHTFRPTIEVLGDVEAIRRVDVSAEIDALVEEVAVEEGQLVEAGKLLVRLKTRSREIQKRAAEARLDTAREQLAEYEKGSRPEEIVAAERAVTETRELLTEANLDLEREKGLTESRIGSEKQLLKARARAGSLKALLQQLEARRDIVRKGPRKEVIARARAQVAMRQADLDAILDEIEKAMIVAPFRGVVTKRLLEKGAYVRRGDPVTSLVQLDPIRVVVPVPERYIGRVQVGAVQELAFDALENRILSAKVEAIIPSADRLARAFPVHLRLANSGHQLLPGMVSRLQLPLGEGIEALAVPRDALVRRPQGVMLCVVAEGDVARLVPVQTGASDRKRTQVKGPVKAGDRVVLRGNEALVPGQKLIVVGEEGAGDRR